MTSTPRSALAPADSEIASLVRRTQSFLDENWAIAWQQHLPEVARTYEAKGEVAYGVYTRRLFAPLLGGWCRTGRCDRRPGSDARAG